MCAFFVQISEESFSLFLTRNGNLEFRTACNEDDLLYDDIGSGLKIKQLQQDKKELLESLEMYYRVFFLGEDVDKEKTEA